VPGNCADLNSLGFPRLQRIRACRYKGGCRPKKAARAVLCRSNERGCAMADNVVRVCSQSEIGPETVKAYEVGDKRLAVYNLEGQFYVTDDECTHASASLADGFLEDGIIECSLHAGAFDVRTGAVKAPPCSFALRTYKVVLQGDDICVDLDKDAAGEPA
jgi:nitrite reductase/ring-hydroxylating ferredoxin subunit